MKKKVVSYLPYFLIIAISLFLLKDLLKIGFPYTHDGHSHLARLANLWLALKSGQFPPRIAPNLDHNFGYPVFNFNYYLSYFFAVIFRVFRLSFETSLKANIIIFYTLGGLGLYSWLKKHTRKSLALFSSVIYLTFPYQLVNIFIRGNIGESAALGVFPWVLYFIDKINKKPSTIIISALTISIFWLTHNLITLLGLPFIAIYFLIKHLKKLKPKKTFTIAFSLFAITSLLVAFFYLPALLEKKYITLDKLSLNTQYDQHFVYPVQLIKDDFSFGYSKPGDQDTMPLTLGRVHTSLLILSLILFLFTKNKKNKPVTTFFALATIASIFMLLSNSLFIYKLIPPLTYLQFPWRWLLLTTITLPTFIGLSLSSLKDTKLNSILITIASIILLYQTLPLTKITNSIHYSNQDYHSFPSTSSVLHENTSIWFDREKNLEFPTQYIYERNNDTKPQITIWNSRKHVYKVSSDQAMNILERTAYFPGWKVYVDNQETEINYQDKQYPGIITFKAPSGEHLVKTVFTQQTNPRIIGNTLSLVSLTASIIYLLTHRKKK